MTEEKLLLKALTEKFSHQKIEPIGSKSLIHGKALKILWNTHCSIKIVKFENGNEFLTEEFLNKLLTKNQNSKS